MSGEFTHYDWNVAAPRKEHRLWQPTSQSPKHETNTHRAASHRGLSGRRETLSETLSQGSQRRCRQALVLLQSLEHCKCVQVSYIQVSQAVQRKITHLPMQEMQLQSLGWEDPLQKEMATHSSVLARETPWTEEPGWLWFMGSQKSQTQLNNILDAQMSLIHNVK